MTDQNGHGTHCAGTVAAATYGVAKSANLVAVAVLGASGSGSTAGVIAGVEYVANDHQSKSNRCVANMSLGGGFSLAMNRAVTEAVTAGCQFAVAAGNENNNACLSSPASEEDCVTVRFFFFRQEFTLEDAIGSHACSFEASRCVTNGIPLGCPLFLPVHTVNCVQTLKVSSSDNTDARSYFSNFGLCSNIFAPGSSITSTWIGSPYAINTISGTSMAAPHICGIMATLIANQATQPTPAGLKSLLASTGTPDMIRDPQNTPNTLGYIGCA
jgi:subtilisin family serine protease